MFNCLFYCSNFNNNLTLFLTCAFCYCNFCTLRCICFNSFCCCFPLSVISLSCNLSPVSCRLNCCRVYFVCVSQATLSRQPLCRALSLSQSLRTLILLCFCVSTFLLFDPSVKLSEVFIIPLILWFYK